MDIYQWGIRPLLFSGLNADPEWLHEHMMQVLQWLDHSQPNSPQHWLRQRIEPSFCFNHPTLKQILWGIEFINPIGLAAGFDKNGRAAGIWSSFGFGFAELGTVTFHAQPGNPKPRLFRLIPDRAVLNRMGFNNEGAVALGARLEHYQATALTAKIANPQPSTLVTPIGINLGKSKVTPLEEAAADYQQSFARLKDLGDYFVINVSSPNTPGLRSLQSTQHLRQILQALQQEHPHQKPLLIKIAPDLEWEAIADILTLAQSHHLAGIIATNTTIQRDGLKTTMIPATHTPVTAEAGGISGAPLRQRSTDVVRFIHRETNGTLPIIGVGGIFTADDAWEKITAGASLLQLYTGWIYEGPWMIRRILEGLVHKLEERGMTHIAQAVGINNQNQGKGQ